MNDLLDVDTDGVCIDRAHRLGRPKHPTQSKDPKRPIIVRFRDYIDTERVLQNAYKLKRTQFGVDRDYPKEIVSARKQLYTSQRARDARARREKVQIRYPARLFIDGRSVDDKFPDWFPVINEDRLKRTTYRGEKYDGGPDRSRNLTHSNVYSRETDSDDESRDDRPVFESPRATSARQDKRERHEVRLDRKIIGARDTLQGGNGSRDITMNDGTARQNQPCANKHVKSVSVQRKVTSNTEGEQGENDDSTAPQNVSTFTGSRNDIHNNRDDGVGADQTASRSRTTESVHL